MRLGPGGGASAGVDGTIARQSRIAVLTRNLTAALFSLMELPARRGLVSCGPLGCLLKQLGPLVQAAAEHYLLDLSDGADVSGNITPHDH